jgi:hypothetical protein
MRLAVMAVGLLATGCTMCPDPFDYAGPVPNGSVAQNDFAARSNGILPVRATPLPWPPIVQAPPQQPTPADDPTAAEPALIATAPDLSPVGETEIVPVLGASLTTPVEPGDESTAGPDRMSVEDPETVGETSDGAAVEPASVPWPASNWQMTPAPATHGLEGPPSHPYLRESRLPREMPPVLIR